MRAIGGTPIYFEYKARYLLPGMYANEATDVGEVHERGLELHIRYQVCARCRGRSYYFDMMVNP